MWRFNIRVLIVLFLLPPGFAWGRSEHHAYRELERVRQHWKREVEQIDKLRRRRTYPHFQFDVF
jgi:hypothetical protein